MKHNFERYCKDYENIENYEAAKKDNFVGWECHHRLETHTSEGERRDADIPAAELKALGMYYHRPAEELIFLTTREHHVFKKGENNPFYGKHHTEETRRRMAEVHKGKQVGENNPFYGKHHTEESKRRNSEAHKNISDETRRKISEANIGNKYNLGKHWYNNGKINIKAKKCPDGFTPGMLRK